MKRLQLNLEAVYIFTDSISQILALDKSPSLFEPPLSRYYSQCNALLFQIGQITDQRKEDMAHFLEQKNYFNPADILSKYNLQQDEVVDWMKNAEMVFRPKWLQTHPKNYMKYLFEQSKHAIEKQARGGSQCDETGLKGANVTVNNVCCELILASDLVTDVKRKLNRPQYELLSSLFYKYHHYPNDVPL